jgi:UDP-N-acetylmuramate: L-alanyl-gamma-D-glutamyl-meso-diaminopimelate ligase
MSPKRHIHLIGICGTAMASLAGMLQRRGYKVTGSDMAAYPPMSDLLQELGIPVLQPYHERHLVSQPDLVVVGNAISRGNAEVEFALNARLPLQSLPQLLHDGFLLDREPVVVAGTHGKTTTTSMLSWIFHNAGRDPSFLVGGVAENFGSSFRLGEGRQFILEGDEYDTAFFDKGPKFLHYFPQALVLTSVEFDHGDIYNDLEAVKTSFKRLVNLVPQRGRIVAWDGGESASNKTNLDDCLSRAFCPVERYGLGAGSYWRAVDLCFGAERTNWTILREGHPWAEVDFALAGEYNVLNATGAAAMAAAHGITPPQVTEALRSFRSVKRRLEVRAVIGGITIIDDFAHHPTAIAETLKALRKRYSGHRLWAVLEPRSNTLARNFFQQELAESLAQADEIVIADVYRASRYSDAERLDVDTLVSSLRAAGRGAHHLPDADAIVAGITPELRAGDVVAVLSNGGFGGIYEKWPAELEKSGN